MATERPRMPTPEDQARVEHQAARYAVAAANWTELLREWMGLRCGAEIQAVLGEPDTSANSLADMARQLSTPGLYGSRPIMRQQGEMGGLVAVDGPLDKCGWPQKMQAVQYLTLALGDMLGRFDVDKRRQRLAFRIVLPMDIWIRPDPLDPTRAIELWEMREFRVGAGKDAKWRYCWEVFDLTGPTPQHRLHLADHAEVGATKVGVLGPEVSDRVEKFHGDDPYPWMDSAEQPIIPYAHWQEVDLGRTWNHEHRRDAHIHALNCALNWTYVGRQALMATGKYVMAANLIPSGVNIHRDAGLSRDASTGSLPMASKTITPGATDYHTQDGDKTPFVWQIDEGVNLTPLLDYADRYEIKGAVRWGLNPSDLTRQAANPSSAAALMVSDEGKQRFSRQIEPNFRRVDLEALTIAAIVHRIGGLGDVPDDHYTIQYPSIRPTPQQAQARRDDMEWQREQGTMSVVDIYQELNPGATVDDSIAALRRVRDLEAELAAPAQQPPKPQPALDPEDPAPEDGVPA